MDFATALGLILSAAGVYFAWRQLRTTRPEAPAQRNVPPMTDQSAGSAFLASSESGLLAAIRERRRLRVGCLWYPPFVEFRHEGQNVVASGLYPMMLQYVAAQDSLHVEYEILRWDTAIQAVTTGKVDVVACVLQSGKRRESCDFVGTLYRVGVGGVVCADQDRVRRHEDLSDPNVRIAVTKGEIGWEYAIRYLMLEEQFYRFTVIEDAQITRMMEFVVSREVDVAIADSLSCAQYVERARADGVYLRDVFAQSPLHVEDNSLMIAKGATDLRKWLSDGLIRARREPAVVALEEKIAVDYPSILIKSPTV